MSTYTFCIAIIIGCIALALFILGIPLDDQCFQLRQVPDTICEQQWVIDSNQVEQCLRRQLEIMEMCQ